MRLSLTGFSPFEPDAAIEKRQANDEKDFRKYGLWGGPEEMETAYSDHVVVECVHDVKSGGLKLAASLYEAADEED